MSTPYRRNAKTPAGRIAATPSTANWGGLRGLLSQYPGAAGAYSLRKIGSEPVVQLRRASDSDEKDFTASELIDGTAETWASSGDAFVRYLYDQSGSGNHAGQSTHDAQPKLISSGSIINENGKPAMMFDGVDDYLEAVDSDLVTGNSAYTVLWVSKSNTIINSDYYFGINAENLGSGDGRTVSMTPELAVRVSGNCIFSDSASGSQELLTLSYDGTTIQNHSLHIDGASSAVDRTANGTSPMNVHAGDFRIGGWGSAGQVLNGTMQEIIVYDSDQSANRVGIETNINEHYGIY